MPGQGRLGDKAQNPADAHGCPACPHPSTGPGIAGSTNVNVNGRPALRVGDPGIHMACCNANQWKAVKGSATVFINGKAAFRMSDATQHCGGAGQLIEGSSDVIVGDGGGGGGGGSGGGGGGGGGGSGGGGGGGGGSSSQSDSQQSSGGGGGGGAPQSSSAATANPGSSGSSSPDKPPQKVAAQWRVQFDDGKSVSGLKVHYDGPQGPKDLTGGSGQVPGLDDGASYDLTLEGTEKLTFTVEDADGKKIAGAKVRVERALGPPVDAETDASGKVVVEGLVGDELVDVTVVSQPNKARGRFVDEEGKPRAGVRARLIGDGGHTVDVVSDGDGYYENDGLVPGEGYTVVVEPDDATTDADS